jgi:hypothetical protein
VESPTSGATSAVAAVNDAPVNTVPVAQTTAEDTTKAITGLSISDVDAGSSSMTVTLAMTNGTLMVSGGTAAIAGSGTSTVTLTGTVAQINATLAATVNYVPTANFNGAATLTMTTSDNGNTGAGGTLTDVDTVAITVTAVNDPPVAIDDIASTNEDTALTIAPDTLLANDTDADGNPLSITSVQAAVNGTVALVAGDVVFTPDTDYNGPASFTYTVSDGQGGSSTATVNLTVNPVNDAPVAGDDSGSTAEDTPITFTAAQLLDNDTDVDGDTLTITGVGPATNGAAVLNPDGSVTFTPTANFNGTASFVYTVADGNGGTDTATVTVNVPPVNDAPIAVNDGPLSTNEDTPLTGINVLGNDTDADGDSLTVTSATSSQGSVLINANGTLDFTPNTNFNGAATISYAISDGNGGSSSASVSITVNPVADLTTTDDTAAGNEDTTISGSVADSTTSGGALTYAVTSGVANGTLVFNNATGAYDYTPNANFNGTDSFSYTVTDAASGESATQSVSITVNPVNDAPVAVADRILVSKGVTVTLPAIALIGNDTDADGDSLRINSVTPGSQVVTLNNDGSVTFAADSGAGKISTFTYTTIDSAGAISGPATVTVETINTSSSGTVNLSSMGTYQASYLVDSGGNSQFTGGAGLDILIGGSGITTLSGGDGNDVLIGGAGNDTLAGGLGADIFKWKLNDGGTPGTPAVDTITDFDATANSDKLDLRDLLQGESANALTNYLHFEKAGGNTLIQISSSGGFTGGTYVAGATDQTIILNGIDLVTPYGTDANIISNLLSQGKLITD